MLRVVAKGSDNPPWDFEADCLDRLRTSRRVLDLGTGGGELVPWNVPNFRIDDHPEKLRELKRAGRLRVTQRRYRLYGHKH